jgi:hypothetical protein
VSEDGVDFDVPSDCAVPLSVVVGVRLGVGVGVVITSVSRRVRPRQTRFTAAVPPCAA